jgi:hypothetical protein
MKSLAKCNKSRFALILSVRDSRKELRS